MEINKRQKKLLEKEAVAVGTVNKDGSPNVIAIAYARVVSVDKVVITDNFMKVTNRNVQRDPRICLCVWDKDWKEGYKFAGKAEYKTSGKWAEYVKGMKENKGFAAKGAIVVKVEEISSLG
ncbi:pyridoxamine 5'-phosphate oxidase family protein [Candidatus Dojkabacteria bacterium]|nr:pyridoxamine 5'-phosphate oxidase family protein [Candidatus Dojkabacteria bacterium]